jgi:hypothetical protein
VARLEKSSSKAEAREQGKAPRCPLHKDEIRFMCQYNGCFKELCGYCILEHQHHIHSIKPLQTILQNALTFYQRFDPKDARESIQTTQNANMGQLDELMKEFFVYFEQKVVGIKSAIITQDKKIIDNVNSKEHFLAKSKEFAARKLVVDSHQLSMLQNYLRSEHIQENSVIKIEVDNFISRFSDIFDDSVKIIKNGINTESTNAAVPKVSAAVDEDLALVRVEQEKALHLRHREELIADRGAIDQLQNPFVLAQHSDAERPNLPHRRRGAGADHARRCVHVRLYGRGAGRHAADPGTRGV